MEYEKIKFILSFYVFTLLVMHSCKSILLFNKQYASLDRYTLRAIASETIGAIAFIGTSFYSMITNGIFVSGWLFVKLGLLILAVFLSKKGTRQRDNLLMLLSTITFLFIGLLAWME